MKNFIQLMLLCILLAFSFGIPTNTFAQTEERFEGKPPCDKILNETVVWGDRRVEMMQLPCGCYVMYEYYIATMPDLTPAISVTRVDINESQPGCTHNFYDLVNGGARDLNGIVDIFGYLEVKLIEKYAQKTGNTQNRVWLASTATCKSKNEEIGFVGIDKGLVALKGDEYWPEMPFHYDSETGEIIFHSDVSMMGCDGSPCCIAYWHFGYDEGFNPPNTISINNGVREVVVDYTGEDVCPDLDCKYSCADLNTYFETSAGKMATTDNIGTTVKVSPNPADDNLTVRIDDYSKRVYNIVVTDVLGNVVFETTQNSNVSSYDISNLSSGTYTVSIYAEETKINTIMLTITK
jgi:hypothetical protein